MSIGDNYKILMSREVDNVSIQVNRKRSIQQKLSFLQGNFQPLIQENHRLKDQLIKNNKQHADAIQALIKQLEKCSNIILKRQHQENQLELMKSYIKALNLRIQDNNKQLQKTKRRYNEQQIKVEEKSKEINKLEAEIRKIQQSYRLQQKNLTAQHTVAIKEIEEQKHKLNMTVDTLTFDLDEKNRQILQLKHTHGIQMADFLKRQQHYKQQMQKELIQVKEKCEKSKSAFEESKKNQIESYSMKLDIKREENTKLKQIIEKMNLKQKNVDVQQSLRMIHYREKLEHNIEILNSKISTHEKQVDKLHHQIKELSKHNHELTHNYNKKLDQCEKMKNNIKDQTKMIDKKDQKIRELTGTIEGYKKEKQDSDARLSKRWEHEIQKIILDYERRSNVNIEHYKIQKDQEFNYERSTLNDLIQNLRKQKIEVQSKFLQEIEFKKKCQKEIQDLEADIVRLKNIHLQEIKHKQEIIKGKQEEIGSKQKQIKKLNSKCLEKDLLIEDKIEQLHKHDLKSETIIEDLQAEHKLQLQKYQQKIEQLLTQKDFQLRQLANDKSQYYQKLIQEIRKGYQQQLTNSKESRNLIVNKLKQEIQQLKSDFEIQKRQMEKEEQEKHWNLENTIREEKISKMTLMEDYIRQIAELRYSLGQQSKSKEDLVGKIKALQQKISQDQIAKDLLIKQINEHKLKIEELEKNLADVKVAAMESIRQYQNQKKETEKWKHKYQNIKYEIIDAKQEMRKQHRELIKSHEKVLIAHKQKLKQMELYITSTPNQSQYLKQISDLKQQVVVLEDQLVQTEAEIINMRQTYKYQQNKLIYLRKKSTEMDITLKTQTPDLDNIQVEARKTNSFMDLNNNKTFNYEKLSRSNRKRRYKIVESNGLKTGIVHYSLVNSLQKNFKLQSVNSKTCKNVVST